MVSDDVLSPQGVLPQVPTSYFAILVLGLRHPSGKLMILLKGVLLQESSESERGISNDWF